jgi:hypothetical protein
VQPVVAGQARLTLRVVSVAWDLVRTYSCELDQREAFWQHEPMTLAHARPSSPVAASVISDHPAEPAAVVPLAEC